MKGFLIALLVFLAIAIPAYALTQEEGADAPTRGIEDYIKDYVDVPAGAIDWKIFGQTKEVSIEGKDADGLEFQYYKPEFSDGVKGLNGKQVTVKGFMFPLESTDEQKLFLFGPFPVNCPFQYHVGPSLVLEVHADNNPVAFSYDPLTITGTLKLVPSDPENNVFYRLENAKISK